MFMRRLRDGADLLLDVGDIAADVPDGVDVRVRSLEVEDGRSSNRFSVRPHGIERTFQFEAVALGTWRGLKGEIVLVRTGALWGIPLAPVWDAFEVLQSLEDLMLRPSDGDGDGYSMFDSDRLAPQRQEPRPPAEANSKRVWSVWTNNRVTSSGAPARPGRESGEFAVPCCGSSTTSSAAIVRWIRPIGGYASRGQAVGDLGPSERDGLFVIEEARVVHLTPDEWVGRVGEEAVEAAEAARAPLGVVLDVKRITQRVYGHFDAHGVTR